MFKLKYLLVALAVCCSSACSSKDKAASSDPASSDPASNAAAGDVPAVGEMVTTSITANDGGDVKLGAAKLAIPGGALDADTDITMDAVKPAADLPDADTVQGPVYAFGPDGTTFSTPADLSLPLPSKPTADQTAVVSWLDPTSNTWQDLDTTVSGSSVTASVPHFTFFVIRFKGVTGPVDCGFTACGGDIVGAWSIDAGCVDDAKSSKQAGLEGCPTATIDAQTEVSGSVEFKADKTFSVMLTEGGVTTAEIPTSCLMGASCDALGESLKATCAASASGCDCSSQGTTKDSSDDGTYTTSGNTFTTTSTGDTTPGDTNEYCVSGKTLKVKTTKSDGTVTILVGSKK